jgi:hypothetical protein
MDGWIDRYIDIVIIFICMYQPTPGKPGDGSFETWGSL